MSPRRLRPRPADPAFYEAVGKAIELSRRYQKLARRDLAREAGISYSYLSEIETGKRGPSAVALLGIARALNLAPSALLAEAESWLGEGEGVTELPAAAPDWTVPGPAVRRAAGSPLFNLQGSERRYRLGPSTWRGPFAARQSGMPNRLPEGESDLGRAQSLLDTARQLSPEARRALLNGLKGIEPDSNENG